MVGLLPMGLLVLPMEVLVETLGTVVALVLTLVLMGEHPRLETATELLDLLELMDKLVEEVLAVLLGKVFARFLNPKVVLSLTRTVIQTMKQIT